jgi:hypothetical protein
MVVSRSNGPVGKRFRRDRPAIGRNGERDFQGTFAMRLAHGRIPDAAAGCKMLAVLRFRKVFSMIAPRPLVAAALLASAVAGCAESGVVKEVQSSSYFLTENYSRGLFDSAQQRAVSRATEYCFKINRRVLVDSVFQGPTNGHGAGTAEVNFRCLGRGDPELQRPK